LLSICSSVIRQGKRPLKATEENKNDKELVTVAINQSNYFIVHAKVDQRAGQLSLPHLGIIKTNKIRTKT